MQDLQFLHLPYLCQLCFISFFLRSELLALVHLSFYTGSVKGNVRISIPTPSFTFY